MRRYPRTNAARKIQGAFRKYRARRMMAGAFRKARGIRSQVMTKAVNPTFVETFKVPNILVLSAAPYLDAWKVRISDIPQIAQYQNLYTQYRINWVKHILIPQYATQDANQAGANGATPGLGYVGLPRMAYSIQDSPNVQVPVSEDAVLEDNGCKIVPIKSKFSMSHRPVPDVAEFANAGGQTVYTKQKYKQWFNFAAAAFPGNNPLHGAVSVSLTLPGGNGSMTFYHYVKVSFSLRDPQ